VLSCKPEVVDPDIHKMVEICHNPLAVGELSFFFLLGLA
jgi:hypothetical protein